MRGPSSPSAHVPGAVRFDIDDIAEKNTDLPHMLPDAETFAAKVGALGIGDADRVIAYDSHGGAAAAARVWWMFRVFGHDNVSVLSGGFKKWQAEGRALEAGSNGTRGQNPSRFVRPAVAAGTIWCARVDQILANIDTRESQVVDARNAGTIRRYGEARTLASHQARTHTGQPQSALRRI